MNKNYIFLVLAVITIVGVSLAYNSLTESKKESSLTKISEPNKSNNFNNTTDNFTAEFAITTLGTKRTFDQPMYHNLSPDAYIEPSNPNIIKVTKRDITWGQFFQTLPFNLTTECLVTGTGQTYCNTDRFSLKFILNDTESPNVLNLSINPDDKLEIIYGE